MSNNSKKKQQQRIQRQKRVKGELPNQDVLNFIDSPNAWTPKVENAWLQELKKISAGEIYRRFPPIRKPPNVRKRGSGSGWGNNA